MGPLFSTLFPSTATQPHTLFPVIDMEGFLCGLCFPLALLLLRPSVPLSPRKEQCALSFQNTSPSHFPLGASSRADFLKLSVYPLAHKQFWLLWTLNSENTPMASGSARGLMVRRAEAGFAAK